MARQRTQFLTEFIQKFQKIYSPKRRKMKHMTRIAHRGNAAFFTTGSCVGLKANPQSRPLNPSRQLQLKLRSSYEVSFQPHVPLFWQGFESHGFLKTHSVESFKMIFFGSTHLQKKEEKWSFHNEKKIIT